MTKNHWVDLCIKQKLIIYICAIALCLLGLFCLFKVSVTSFPQLSFNRINIHLSYSGASAYTMESQVTSKVVDALKGTENIREISATSRAGRDIIRLRLDSIEDTDLIETKINIMEAISASHLPAAVSQPRIEEAAGRSGLITYIITSNTFTNFELDNFVQAQLYPKFISLPGVSIYLSSEDPVIRVKLNPAMIAKFNLNLLAISQLVNTSYKDNPLGELYIDKQNYTLGLKNHVTTLNQLENLIIGYNSAGPVYLKNIAKVSFEPQEITPDIYTGFNGHPAVTMSLFTKSSADPFAISTKTREEVRKLKNNLQEKINITPIFDTVKNMKASIHEVLWTIFIASVLVLLIALMFLGRLRTTIIPIITIPICLLGTVFIINLLGYTINVITLLALVIAVGLVVDDAIVVVENITRYLELGHKKHEAIILGTSNIALTIIGITLTLLAAYLPIVLCQGPFITLIKNFAVPLACAVFISGIVALTLTPVMSLHLVNDNKPNNYQIKFEKILNKLIAYYHNLLKVVLNKPYFSIFIILCLIFLSIYAALKLPQQFFPKDPNGTVAITILDNGQDSIESLREKSKQFKKFYQQPSVNYFALDVRHDKDTGRLGAQLNINYKDSYLHQTISIADEINQFIQQENITNASAKIHKFSNWGSGADFSFRIIGTSNNIELTNKIARKLTKIMRNNSALFTTVDNTINLPRKQIEFDINTVKAAKFGIYQPDISRLLSTYYGGYSLDNNFSIDGLSVPIILQLENNELKNPSSINDLLIQSATTHQLYPLSNFVSLNTTANPEMIDTFDGHPTVEINAALNTNTSLNQAINYAKNLIQQVTPNVQFQFTGNTADYLEGNSQRNLIIILGVLSIYFLLAILFNSLVDPFIILLTVPFSILGGALSLYLINGSINLYSTLGLITLIGLITKHGVLIVQFANQELKKNNNLNNSTQHITVHTAILRATQHRFRPIIMTTLAMTLGALPLVFSSNLMYVARRELGTVIIGGLIIGTVFSLFIVPLVYSLIKKGKT